MNPPAEQDLDPKSLTGPQRRMLRARVKAVIDAADPVGLLEMGCPTDEYDNEIDDFVELLGRTDSLSPLTAQDVIAVWEKWFYPGIGGTSPVDAAELAGQLNAVRYACPAWRHRSASRDRARQRHNQRTRSARRRPR